MEYLNLLIQRMFKSPFSFEGRIRRKEYVFTFLILYILSFVLGYVIGDEVEPEGGFLILFLLVFAATMWMQLAQTAKRCHDVNRSGWYQLIPFYTIYLLFAEGDKFRNSYGPSPKYDEDNEDTI